MSGRLGISVLAVVALLAAGCGGDDDAGGTDTTAAAATTTVADDTTGDTAADDTTGDTAADDTTGNTASDVGVTPDEIVLGNVSTLTGPIPGLFAGGPAGTEAFFAYINSQGGVHGRQLKLEVGDDALDCNRNIAETEDLVDDVFAFVGSFATFDNCMAQVLTDNPEVPDVHYQLSSEATAVVNSFSPQPQPPGFRTGQYLYFQEQFPEAVDNVGALWATTSPTTWENQRAAMESVGFTVKYERGVAPTETDFTADIVRMKDAGVQYLDLRNLDKTVVARVLQAVAQQSFEPDVINTNAVYDTTFFDLLPDPSVADGVVIDQPFAMFLGEDAEAVPEVALFLEWMEKTNPDAVVDLFAMFSWASARLFVDALDAAGPNPTRAGLLEALADIHSFDGEGMVAEADVGNHEPPTCLVFIEISGGEYHRILPDSGYECRDDWGYFLRQ